MKLNIAAWKFLKFSIKKEILGHEIGQGSKRESV